MTTVEIDIEKLSTAMTELDNLSIALSSATTTVRYQSPVPLPSLTNAAMRDLEQWLSDQKPELKTRRDLAILLNKGGSTGTISFTVTDDNLTEIEKRLGQEIAKGLDDINPDAEPGAGLDVADMLKKYKNNANVTSAMYGELGPERSAEVLRMLKGLTNVSESYKDEYTDLYTSMTGALPSASTLLDRDWANEFTTYLMPPDAMSDDIRLPVFGSTSGPDVLADLLDGGTIAPDFLKGMGDEIERGERVLGDKAPGVWKALAGDDVGDLLMKQFSRHPEDALDWLQEGDENGRDRQTYWFNDRDFSNTGYDGVAQMVDKISTNPALMKDRPYDAAAIVTTFFDLVANSPGFTPENASASSDSLSHIMAVYMPAVMNGVGIQGDADWPVPDGEFVLSPFGNLGVMPLFQHDDLKSITAVAMSTEDGMATVAQGYTQLTTQRLAALADSGNITSGALSTILSDEAGLRGFLDRGAADAAINAGASADEKKRYFSNLVSEAAGILPIPKSKEIGEHAGDLVKNGYNYAVKYTINAGEEAANNRWATSEEEARDLAVSSAQHGYHESAYSLYRSLVGSGLVSEDALINGTHEGGAVKSYADLENPRSYNDNIRALLTDLDLNPNEILGEYYTQYNDPLAGVR